MVVVHPYLLYFDFCYDKSDVRLQEGFKLAVGTAVTFQAYVDHEGASAFEVSPAMLTRDRNIIGDSTRTGEVLFVARSGLRVRPLGPLPPEVEAELSVTSEDDRFRCHGRH